MRRMLKQFLWVALVMLEKDIGGTCLFLASDAAFYISGQTIMVQGIWF